jgi:hypothetical protein
MLFLEKLVVTRVVKIFPGLMEPKNSSLDPIARQFKAAPIFTSCFCTVHFNRSLLFMSLSVLWFYTHLHLVPRSKNAWSYTSTPPYIFLAWCLAKHRVTLPFYDQSNVFFSPHECYVSCPCHRLDLIAQVLCSEQNELRSSTLHTHSFHHLRILPLLVKIFSSAPCSHILSPCPRAPPN